MTSDLTPRVAGAAQPLGLVEEAQDPKTAGALVEQAITDLHAVLEEGDSTEADRYQAHLLIAQSILQFTHYSDVVQLDEALNHLRVAYGSVPSGAVKGPDGSSHCVVASMFGQELMKRARGLAPPEAAQAAAEAEHALRRAIELSEPDDPELPLRLSNLALSRFWVQLTPDPVPESNLREAASLLRRADNLLSVGSRSRERAMVLANLGHCIRTLASVIRTDDVEAAGQRLVEAEGRYLEADEVATRADIRSPVSQLDWSLLRLDQFEATSESDLLAEALSHAEAGRGELADDDPYRAEAEMLTAEIHLRFFEVEHGERSLKRALALSESAAESYYVQRGGTLHGQLLRRRALILQKAVSAAGSWGHERRELKRIADDLELDRSPEIVFLDMSAELEDERLGLGERSSSQAVFECADRLRNNVASAAFSTARLRWIGRYAEAEILLFETLIYYGSDPPIPRIEAAARLLQGAISETTPYIVDHVFGVHTLARLREILAVGLQSRKDLDGAASAARTATDLLAEAPSLLPTDVSVHTALTTQRLAFYAGHAESSEKANLALLDGANRLEPPAQPDDLLLASTRLRSSVAASAAIPIEDLRTSTWTQYALTAGLDCEDQSTRSLLLDSIEEMSAHTTQLFLAISEIDARAIIIEEGTWSKVDLPTLAMKGETRSAVERAYRRHEAASTGNTSDRREWDAARGTSIG